MVRRALRRDSRPGPSIPCDLDGRRHGPPHPQPSDQSARCRHHRHRARFPHWLARTAGTTESEFAAAVGPGAAACGVAAIFLVVGGVPSLTGAPLPHPVSLLDNMWTSFSQTGGRLQQTIGDFGWLDTPVATWVVVVWGTCIVGLTAAALFLSASCRRALPVLALLVLAMPLALESPQINSVGTFWQGRYWLPVAVGFPLVAATFTWHGDGPAGPAIRPAGTGWPQHSPLPWASCCSRPKSPRSCTPSPVTRSGSVCPPTRR